MTNALFLLAAGALCLLASGCAQSFNARPIPAASVASAETGGAGVVRAGSAASCLHVLAQADAGSDEATRRAATLRLIELYAPALLAAGDRTIQVADGTGRMFRVRLRRGLGPGGVNPSRFVALEPVDRFAVSGVQRFSRTSGEGAPLVGTLRPILPVGLPEPTAPRPAAGLVWAVTAMPVSDPAAGGRSFTLDLYDPHMVSRTVGPGGRSRVLAADYTTPLAVASTRFRPQRRGLLGFLRPEKYFSSAGLYPTESPTTGKIPLVLVHGLVSDPGDFRELRNALAGNPDVRRRYQVWVFYYPTSLPVIYSAMLLREALEKLTLQLDPAGMHPAVHRLVLVGHSMGGLLCRLDISEGGDVYYHHFFRQPVDELNLTAAQRALVRRAFYYRASTDVAQVVFIATPHHGSRLASGLLGNVGRLLVRIPRVVLSRITPIVANNRDALVAGAAVKPGSSLDSLAPHAPLIAAINDLPMRPGVRLHSILGDRGRGGPPEDSSDGVVPYASSHLPEAESERIVPAGHTGTLARPETADEIFRVLR